MTVRASFPKAAVLHCNCVRGHRPTARSTCSLRAEVAPAQVTYSRRQGARVSATRWTCVVPAGGWIQREEGPLCSTWNLSRHRSGYTALPAFAATALYRRGIDRVPGDRPAHMGSGSFDLSRERLIDFSVGESFDIGILFVIVLTNRVFGIARIAKSHRDADRP